MKVKGTGMGHGKLMLAGERIGMLLVVKEVGKDMGGHITWECLCDCGNFKIVTSAYLRRPGYKNCGCETPRKEPEARPHLDASIRKKDALLWAAYLAFKHKSRTELQCCMKDIYKFVKSLVEKPSFEPPNFE